MKKHISTSIFNCILGYILLLLTIFFIIIECLTILFLIFPDGETPTAEYFFIISGINLICIFLVFLFNRANYWIWIEDDSIKRKGFWFGFEKEIVIADIERVETFVHHSGGRFICLITDNKGIFVRSSREGYISFRYSKKNLKFLNTFWNGRVDGEYKWKSEL